MHAEANSSRSPREFRHRCVAGAIKGAKGHDVASGPEREAWKVDLEGLVGVVEHTVDGIDRRPLALAVNRKLDACDWAESVDDACPELLGLDVREQKARRRVVHGEGIGLERVLACFARCVREFVARFEGWDLRTMDAADEAIDAAAAAIRAASGDKAR